MKDNVQPVFHKPYTVSCVPRDDVGQKLYWLKFEGTISKVKYADWDIPMGCVLI